MSFFYLSGFVRYTRKPKDDKILFLLSTAFGTEKQSDKMEVCKGKVWRFFRVVFSKKYYLTLRTSKRWHESKFHFAEVAEVRFFLFLFSLKKKKGLNLLVRLVELSATPSKPRRAHTL